MTDNQTVDIEKLKYDFTKKFGLNAYLGGEMMPSGKTDNISINAVFDFFKPYLTTSTTVDVMDFAVWASADPDTHVVKLAEKYLSNKPTSTSRVQEQCFCKSYYDENNELKDCTCGRCGSDKRSK